MWHVVNDVFSAWAAWENRGLEAAAPPQPPITLREKHVPVVDHALIKPGMYLGHLSIRELVLLQQELRDEERSR